MTVLELLLVVRVVMNKDVTLKKVSNVYTSVHTTVLNHTHLAIGSFSQHSKKLKTVRSNSLTVSVDTFTGQLHLLCLHTGIAWHRKVAVLVIKTFVLYQYPFFLDLYLNINLLLWFCHSEVTDIILQMGNRKIMSLNNVRKVSPFRS